MHELVSFNEKILSAAETSVSAVSSSSLYGKGVFTTIAVYGGEPFLWKKHTRRLFENANKLGIDTFDLSEKVLLTSTLDLIRKNEVLNGKVRITIFDESQSPIWPLKSGRKSAVLILTGYFRRSPFNFRISISPHRLNSLSPLTGIKSCNYVEKLLSLDEAKTRGFNETIQLNELGHVAGATMANVFWIKDVRLYTPSVRTGCLAGTTREFVMENIDCLEVEVEIDELENVDAIFLTSSGIGVVRVAEFDEKTFEPLDHPILHLLPS